MRQFLEQKGKIMTREEIQECLDYDPGTGRISWRNKTSVRTKIGAEAGSIDGDGYRLISLRYKKRSAHRLAFELMGVDIPDGMQVDHINRKRDDNRWCNLRLVTGQQNNMNTKMQKNNKSGVTGVFWNNKKLRWVANISFKGKQRYLGSFKNLEEAVYARRKAEKEFGFVSGHGKPDHLDIAQ
jgi:hypothetical protein